ncbi:superoxide dismutase [Cu-Zn]-like [Carcharodon carcharias]|uniref:superoxide dismutase [Cu-Zn]-like n=1 Tax=Carcharodon carcharias TaxID=13397 RepID=UPI001B7DAE23|nr:superoxide dismutase [Cu-Zn]-like [Carcharodon carcharias]
MTLRQNFAVRSAGGRRAAAKTVTRGAGRGAGALTCGLGDGASGSSSATSTRTGASTCSGAGRRGPAVSEAEPPLPGSPWRNRGSSCTSWEDCGCAETGRDAGHRAHSRGEQGPAAHAICLVQPNTRGGTRDSNITGEIRIQRQSSNRTEIMLDLHGFPSNRKSHAMHIHEFGDLSQGCETLGGHFNPHNKKHGSHAGDLGNFQPSPDGAVRLTLANVQLHLQGSHSIVGRSIVIHENEDDLGHHDSPGSLVHGNAGQRLACCVIGVASGLGWPTGVQYTRIVFRKTRRQ